MANVRFVPYDDGLHRDDFFQLNLEYLTGLDEEISARYGVSVNPGGTVREYIEGVFQKFTEIKPSEGIVYILEIEGEAVGMGALKKLEDGVGEIKRMYIRSNHRGKGYGKRMYNMLEEKAREYGYSTLRLDTAGFAEAAVHIYRKAGFREIDNYSGGEWDGRSDTEGITMYMEKNL